MLSLIWLFIFSLLFVSEGATISRGEVTFYFPGLGACGGKSTSNDLVAAVSGNLFNTFPGATANPNKNPICGQRITAKVNGKSVTVTVRDKCPGCRGKFDLDLSPAAFKRLAPLSVGRLEGVTWNFVGGAGKRGEDIETDIS